MLPHAFSIILLAFGATVHTLDISQCIGPLGMESGEILDKDVTASSSFNDGNVGPQNGRLNAETRGGAWCPRNQITTESTEWIEIDLHVVHVITSVGTQGRFGNGQGQEFAESYVLEYWRPQIGKWKRYRLRDETEIMAGNTNTYLVKKVHLDPPIWASKIRFIPYSSHRRTVCMRVELYGCFWSDGIVAYTIPKGDKRSNGIELTDVIYDGQWGDELRGGLGQLIDGQFGGDEIREAAKDLLRSDLKGDLLISNCLGCFTSGFMFECFRRPPTRSIPWASNMGLRFKIMLLLLKGLQSLRVGNRKHGVVDPPFFMENVKLKALN